MVNVLIVMVAWQGVAVFIWILAISSNNLDYPCGSGRFERTIDVIVLYLIAIIFKVGLMVLLIGKKVKVAFGDA